MSRTLKIGATAPALRFYVADEAGPINLSAGAGVTAVELETLGPTDWQPDLTPDADQDTEPAEGALTGRGWASVDPPSTLELGRYACVVTLTTSDGTELYPAEGYEVLTVEAGRRTFAAVSDVARRMGVDADSLTDAQIAQRLALLEAATDLIADACGKDLAWSSSLNPVPDALRITCVEMTVRVLYNPTGATMVSEGLGAYTSMQQYAQGGVAIAGLELTAGERLRCRRAVFGRTSASVRLTNPSTEYAVLYLAAWRGQETAIAVCDVDDDDE